MVRVLLLSGIALLSAPVNHQASAQAFSLTLETVVTIGDSDDVGEEYLFGIPKQVVVDGNGNIYLSEHQSMEIRMFGVDGQYIRTLGASGAAPGEFVDVSAITVNQDNELVVFDRRSDRVTVFDSAGDLVDTYQLGLSADIWDAIQLTDGSYAVHYFAYASRRTGREPGEHIVHVVEDGFATTLRSFVGTDDLYEAYDDVPFVNLAWYSSDSIVYTTDAEDNVYVAPLYYDGTIYVYRSSENYQTRYVFSNHSIGDRAAEYLDHKKRFAAAEQGHWVSGFMSATNGEHAAVILRRSQGFMWLPGGDMLHFYADNSEDSRVVAEWIDRSGAILGTTNVQPPHAMQENTVFSLHDSSAEGLIYTTDGAQGYPVIRVYRVHFKNL